MKNTILTILGVTVFIALAIGILTALKQFSSKPSVILTSTQCNPPCWYGIQPGKTDYIEIPGLLEQISSLGEKNINWEFDKNDRLININWTFQRPVDDSYGYIYFDENKVAKVIKIYTINSLTISELFEKLGEPEQYWMEVGNRENQDEYLDIYFLYPTNGYLANCVVNIEYGKNQVEISNNTPVYLVAYFSPDMYSELLNTKILINKTASSRSGSAQTWKGLGLFQVNR